MRDALRRKGLRQPQRFVLDSEGNVASLGSGPSISLLGSHKGLFANTFELYVAKPRRRLSSHHALSKFNGVQIAVRTRAKAHSLTTSSAAAAPVCTPHAQGATPT